MELKIDKQLAKIERRGWGSCSSTSRSRTTGVPILKRPAEDVIEALDDNEVALQTMMGNRFMGFFETQIVDVEGQARGRARGARELDGGAAPVVLARGDLHRLGGHPRAAARGRQALRRHRRLVQGADGGRLADAQPARRVPRTAATRTSRSAWPRSSCATARSPTTSRRSARSSRGSTSSRRSTSSTPSPRASTRPPCRSTSPSSPTTSARSAGRRTPRRQAHRRRQGDGLGRQARRSLRDAARVPRARRGLAARADGALLRMLKEQLELTSRASSRRRARSGSASGARSSASRRPPDLVDVGGQPGLRAARAGQRPGDEGVLGAADRRGSTHTARWSSATSRARCARRSRR